MATEPAVTSSQALPEGSYRVDPAGRLGFRVKTMWGLAWVKGRFTDFEGELHVDASGTATGALTVRSASLDTENAKRDEHLRGPDFFHAERHPTIRFTTTAVTPAKDGLTVSGDLQIGDTTTRLQLPVTATPDGDGLKLTTHTSVERERVQLGWNKLGMIKGAAHLDAEIDLVPA